MLTEEEKEVPPAGADGGARGGEAPGDSQRGRDLPGRVEWRLHG